MEPTRPALRQRSNVFSRNAWIALTLFPFAWTSWAAFLYVGARVRRRQWLLASAGYLALAIVFTALIISEQTPQSDIGLGICLITWPLSVVHAIVIRKEFVRRLELRLHVEDGELDRELAFELAKANPAQALDIGVGRPDLPGARAGGVVDVNHASPAVLATLPGIDARLARQIAGTREAMGLFGSVAELGMVLDLPADTVERLRPLVVFLR